MEEKDVEQIVAAKYGVKGGEVFAAMRRAEMRRHALGAGNVYQVPRGEDIFQRNLKALHFVAASGKSSDAVERMYADALADLNSIYPNGTRPGEGVNLYEAWKHVLDTTAERARKNKP